MRSSLAAVGLTAVLTGLLVSCSDDTEAYCASLREARAEFQALESGNLSELQSALDRIQQLGREAPEAVHDEWETVNGRLDDALAALDDAGLQLEDLEGIQDGQLPEDVDAQRLMELGTQLQGMFGEETQQAMDAISQHAQQECGVDLEGGAP